MMLGIVVGIVGIIVTVVSIVVTVVSIRHTCLLYTSDAADE